MRLFDQFVIREQEIFACRVVNYLLQRSPELRAGLVQAVSDTIPDLWLLNDHHFSSTLESSLIPSPSEDPEPGRIDILIEIDNAILAIEAKLTAALRSDQPRKYLLSLDRSAQQLALLRGPTVAGILLLLVPEARRHEAEQCLALCQHPARVRSAVLTWEHLFETWRTSKVTDSVALFVLDELEHLVLTQIGRRKDFNRLAPALRAPLAQAMHDAHAEFVGWVYPAFRTPEQPYLTSRTTSGRAPRTYVGRYFAVAEIDDCWGWYGFIEPRFAEDPQTREPAFVVGLDLEVTGLSDAFEQIHVSHPGFYERATWWRIRFDKSWDNLTRWHQTLQPVREAIARAAAGT